MTWKGLEVLLAHWAMGIHLAFRTRHLGVNNRLWTRWPSPWGWPLWRIALSILLVKPVFDNLRSMRLRMSHSHGWAPVPDYEAMFGARRLYLTPKALAEQNRSLRFDLAKKDSATDSGPTSLH